MTSILPVTLPIADDETVTSFTARLAAENGAPSVSDFCRDLGIDWNGVISGDKLALEALARVSGAPVPNLIRQAIRLIGQRTYAVGSQQANRMALCRSRLRVCPQCVKSDLSKRGRFGAARKASWQLNSIRNCEIHCTPLIELPSEQYMIDNYDFCRLIDRHIDLIQERWDEKSTTSPSRLELYLMSRLRGRSDFPWLDELPLYVAARTCEMLGLQLLFGELRRVNECSELQIWQASEAGFDVVSQGPDALINRLQHLRYSANGFGCFLHYDLGVFLKLLVRAAPREAYEPVKSVVRKFIFENYPIGGKTKILGSALGEQRLYSIDKTAKRLRLKTHIVQLALCELNQARINTDTGKVEMSGYVEVDDLYEINREAKNLVLERKAREILGVTERMLQALIDEGLVHPRQGLFRVNPRYLARELRELLKKVHRLSCPVNSAGRGLVPIRTAAMKARCKVAQIVGLILNKRLTNIEHLVSEEGLTALLADPKEVRLVLRDEA